MGQRAEFDLCWSNGMNILRSSAGNIVLATRLSRSLKVDESAADRYTMGCLVPFRR